MARSSEIKEIGRITTSSATIEWKINNYFGLSQKIGKEYNSPSFNFLNAEWYLRLLPNGEKGSVNWIGLHLHREESVQKNHDIKFTLGIRNGDGSIYHSWSTYYEFEEDAEFEGTDKLVLKTSILENAHKVAPGKQLAIFCVLNDNDHQTDSSSSDSEDEDVSEGLPDTWNPSSTEEGQAHIQKESFPDTADVFFKDMKNLLVSERLCDVKILIKRKELQAHKAILAARSSVFSALFEDKITGKKSNIVEILDCEFDVFKEFLHYLYTGKVQEISEINICEMYVLAVKYGVKQLKGDCIAIMNHIISEANFCDLIFLAVEFNESELKEKAMDYFLKNTENILQTVNWKRFKTVAPEIADELRLMSILKS